MCHQATTTAQGRDDLSLGCVRCCVRPGPYLLRLGAGIDAQGAEVAIELGHPQAPACHQIVDCRHGWSDVGELVSEIEELCAQAFEVVDV